MASTPRPQRRNTTQRAPKRSRIEIRLPSKPRDYVPGSGPPLQRLGLLPAQDSTAYIVERILLPPSGNAADGKPLPRRMTYIVGWRDLPAARLLVPAMEVLRYVSPRALEAWEWERELENDTERVKLEEQKKMPPAEIVKKKKGRPPVHSQIEAANIPDPEAEAEAMSRPKTGAMSLSTPQKAKLDFFVGLSEEDESPSQQIQRELDQQQGLSDSEDLMDLDGNDLMEYGSEMEGFEEEIRREFMQASSGQNQNSRPTFEGQLDDVATPVPEPAPLHASRLEVSIRNAPLPSFSNAPAQHSQNVMSHSRGFKPAGWSSTAFSSQATAEPMHNGTSNHSSPVGNGVKTKTARPKPKSKTAKSLPTRVSKPSAKTQKPSIQAEPAESKPQPASPDEETAWEVERIEDMQLYDVEGRGLVYYYKVRWEGDWPPDQNPSWEPEENLPPNLIRNYRKHPKRNRVRSSGKRKAPAAVATPWGTGKPYSSVSEAFADDVDTAESNGATQGGNTPDVAMGESGKQDFDGEEVFVVDEDVRLVNSARNGFGMPKASLMMSYLSKKR